MNWRHSGFSIDNGMRIARDDEKGRESVAQYILRNPFSVEKMTYNDKNETVFYRSKMTNGKNRKNFNDYSAEEFIAAITQHIPQKSFQMVRYYGWYSNKSRGLRLKQGMVRPGDEALENDVGIEIIDVSEYEPKRSLSQTRLIRRGGQDVERVYQEDMGGRSPGASTLRRGDADSQFYNGSISNTADT